VKVSVNKRRLLLGGGVLVLILLGLAVGRAGREAGPGRLDSAASRACDDFAAGYANADTQTARLALSDQVNKSSAESDNAAIAAKAVALGDSADEGRAAWGAAAEDFTQACRDAGWNRPQ
jgi:hypothetical protein